MDEMFLDLQQAIGVPSLGKAFQVTIHNRGTGLEHATFVTIDYRTRKGNLLVKEAPVPQFQLAAQAFNRRHRRCDFRALVQKDKEHHAPYQQQEQHNTRRPTPSATGVLCFRHFA